MKDCNPIRYRNSRAADKQSGIALILALISLFVVTTLAIGVMYSSQSEIWTTANYTATTQARYVAEAGLQQALNYLASGTYQPPTTFITSGQTNFSLNTMPVMYGTGCTTVPLPSTCNTPVIMATGGFAGTQYADTESTIDAALTGQTVESTFTSTFASSMYQTPFANIVSGGNSAKFDVAIQLLSATQNSTDGKWLMRWKIVSQGTLNTLGTSSSGGAANPKARVQVVEVVDNVKTYAAGGSTTAAPAYSAGVFATGTGCNTITMSGGQYTNAYTSTSQLGVLSPTLLNTGGNVGSFGNVHITNGAYIIGNVYTPFYNVGANGTYGISGGPLGLNSSSSCVSPGTIWSVNEDNSGSGVGCTSMSAASCSQKTYNLPSPPPSYPTPCLPSGNCASVPATVAANTTAVTSSSSGIWYGLLGGGSGGGHGCAVTVAPSGGTTGGFTSPANFGAVNMGSCAVITLQAGTYNMDSLYISNGAKVILPASGSVVINILDQGSTTNPLNIDGGTFANGGQAPINLTIVYAGTKQIDVNAGANMFGTIYAPNASAVVTGNAGLYGAMVINTIQFQGSGHVIYDTALNGQAWNVTAGTTTTPSQTTGSIHVDEFSWSAF